MVLGGISVGIRVKGAGIENYLVAKEFEIFLVRVRGELVLFGVTVDGVWQ